MHVHAKNIISLAMTTRLLSIIEFGESSYQRLGVVLLSLVSCMPLYGQEACFTVDVEKGCAPLTVTVTDCSGVAPSNILYDVQGNVTTENVFVFDEPGTFTIRQIIGTPDGGKETSKTVEVLESTEPRFTLTACSNKTIQLDIDGGIYDSYLVDFGDGTTQAITPSEQPQHSYAAETVANVTVRGLFNGAVDNCSESTESLPLLENILPGNIQQIEMNSGNQVNLQVSLETNTTYLLEEGNGGIYEVAESVRFGTNQITLEARTPPSCYRLRVEDPCTGTQTLGNELCSVSLAVSSSAQENQITWQPYSGTAFEKYELYKDGVLLFENSVAGTTSFTDTNVECLQSYCYQLRAYTTEGVSISAEQCVTTQAATQSFVVNQFYTSVEDENGVLRWQVPNGVSIARIRIEKAENQGQYIVLADSAAEFSTFTDIDLSTSNSVCYRIILEDICGSESEPTESCTVSLKSEKAQTDNLLNWNSYSGFPNYQYYLEVYSDADSLTREIGPFDATITTYLDAAENLEGNAQVYRLRIENLQGGEVAFSNFQRIAEPSILKVPDAFTPNGDGLNDTFAIIGTELVEFRIDIYGRWGNVIFSSEEIERSWEGILKNGKEAPKGPYTWVIKAKSAQGATFQEKGIVLLLR